MRNILLATTAMLAASIGLVMSAEAQTTTSTAAPGSVIVRLNGRVNWYAGVESSSLDSIAGTKTSTTSFLSYFRLFPGFDGIAANGLHYGAAAEIRINSGSSASSETLYVHQAYGYLGLPKLGQVSFGQENGPVVVFETGTFEGFNDGGWWGDLPGIVPTNAEAVYPFVDNGGLSQETDKIVYLSPTFGGFQFGLGYEPNHTAENETSADTTVTTAVSGGTPRNLIDFGGQYTKTFGGIGIQIGADYLHSGQVSGTGSQSKSYTTPSGYHDLSIISGGATVSAAGFTVGGNAVYGDFNQVSGYTFELEPNGGQAAIGVLVGAQYTMGPVVVGASVFRFNTTGDLPGGIDAAGGTISSAGLTTGQQVNNGLAAGGTYTLVPGVSLFVDYDYGWRHQGGYDFATGDAGADHNNVQSQLFGVGTQVQW
ncbi:porin [Acidisoma cladoniae]|jgi:outer membrane protein OmpU|uniref:porin n=1 Tax=Acidisoma cladoniae TaxID=3040935 RepID=UPI00254F4DBF|nr:porin [Acidisoma sp. PAMC 29798]